MIFIKLTRRYPPTPSQITYFSSFIITYLIRNHNYKSHNAFLQDKQHVVQIRLLMSL